MATTIVRPAVESGGPLATIRRRRTVPIFAGGAALLAVLVVCALAFGPVRVPFLDTVKVVVGVTPSDPRWQVLVGTLRMPRVLTALLIGPALAVAGLQMQTLFGNALADPYTLGVSSGASLGVAVVALLVGTSSAAQFASGLAAQGRIGTIVAAAGGAAAVLGLVLVMARWVRSAVTLLLIGVMIGSASVAIISVLLVYADPQRVQQFLVWGLGSFTSTTQQDLALLGPIVAAGIAGAVVNIRALNALLIGESYARTMGINVRRARLLTLVSASVLAGVATAYCGPIAFVGLAVPHLARILYRTADHRILVPGCALFGAVVAVLAGMVSQLPDSDVVIPVNAVTSVIGAPVVIVLLLRSRVGVDGVTR